MLTQGFASLCAGFSVMSRQPIRVQCATPFSALATSQQSQVVTFQLVLQTVCDSATRRASETTACKMYACTKLPAPLLHSSIARGNACNGWGLSLCKESPAHTADFHHNSAQLGGTKIEGCTADVNTQQEPKTQETRAVDALVSTPIRVRVCTQTRLRDLLCPFR
jgi:hypothetical protein